MSLRSDVQAVGAGTARGGLVRARAYSGDAHHHEWAVPRDEPPEYVDLPVATGTQRYRLVRNPVTGRVAVDPEGALVFVPALKR
jgi:hypothetical protein